MTPFADAVVALDDGSEGDTADAVRNHPLVATVLTNPPQPVGAERNDSVGNWTRLLVAAVPLRPDWILMLEGNERLNPTDALVLRDFINSDARPGFAFGFRVPAHGGNDVPARAPGCTTPRLFSYRPGQRFARSAPGLLVPTDVPRGRWIDTALCLRTEGDEGGGTGPARAGRPVVDWTRLRAMCDHVAAGGPLGALDPARPTLSAVVISQNDRDRIIPVMDALTRQVVTEPTEIILVDSGTEETAAFVRARYPTVRVIHLPDPALPSRARNVGLMAARGDYVTFPGSHVVVQADFLQQRIDAHARGYAMASGHVLNGTHTMSGWASYFLDHCTGLPGRPSGELTSPPVAASYLREPLLWIGGFPEDCRAGEDTVVNRALFDLGYPAYHAAGIGYMHNTPCRTPIRLVRHHFSRGMAYGRIRRDRSSRAGERGREILHLLIRYPARRMWFVGSNVARWGRSLTRHYVLSLPLQVAGVAAATVGALACLVFPRRRTTPADHRTGEIHRVAEALGPEERRG